jgi:hypothetical protein
MRLSYAPWAVAAVAILSALVVVGVGTIALVFALKVPVDPREGWNAYNAAAAIGGGHLYPGDQSLWFNNYPPLSYFAIGGLSVILRDAIVAGRIVALVSALSAAGFVALAASRMQCSRFESFFAGILFAASPWVLTKYAQMNDPQMLGQALGCAGFVIVVWQPGRIAFVALGAFLLTLALFVKPLFVVQPVALMVWLAIYDRRSAAFFLAFGIAFCVAGLIMTNVLLKTDLVHDMLLARVYSPSRIFSHPGQWLASGFAPLTATLYLLRCRNDRTASLCMVYALVAIPFSLFFSGGEGVAGNATFDLSIACALGAAVSVNRLRGPEAHCRRDAATPSIVVVACALPLAVTFVVGMFGAWASGPSIWERMKREPAAQRDIAFVEAHAGPALCEDPALCYWAGKPAQVDVWGFGQALAKHARSEAALTSLLDAQCFSVIERNSRSAFIRSAKIRSSLGRHYKQDHADPLGIFLVPTAGNPLASQVRASASASCD